MADEMVLAVERASVPISALEHYAYCPRQAALIHLEGFFESSVDTVRGDLAHAAVNQHGADADRHRVRVWRSLPVWSDRLAVHGICDVVQFGADGPVPVEHKSGAYHPGGPADLQVAAQVLCLREMFDAAVPIGLIFSGRDRRRHEVVVDDTLASLVAETADRMRSLYSRRSLPPPVADSRCRRCSLRQGCMPEAPRTGDGLRLYQPRALGTWDD
jgi:CRISPR-associated exonuclease Cas4